MNEVDRGAPPPTRDEQDGDPQPEEKPAASGNLIAFYMIAIALVFGALFYALSDRSITNNPSKLPASNQQK